MDKNLRIYLMAGLLMISIACGSSGGEAEEDPGLLRTQIASTLYAEMAPIEKPATTNTPAYTDTPAVPSFSDGTWIIETDIPAGTYRTDGSDSCYWERLSGFGGTLAEIIANDNPDGQVVVTILQTDKGFTTKRCGTWVMINN